MSEKPTPLVEAVRRLTAAEKAAAGRVRPSPEELLAYRDGSLDAGARDEIERYLSMNPKAVEEYLDLVDPSRLEAPGNEHEVSDDEVRLAFEGLKGRLGLAVEGRSTGAVGANPVPQSPVPQRPIPHKPVPSPFDRRVRNLRLGLRLSALAAVLTVLVAGAWILHLRSVLEDSTGPRFAAIIDVHPTRGERPSRVSSQARDVLLVFHDAHVETYSDGWLEITDSEGHLVLGHSLKPAKDREAFLCLPVPRALLPNGSYRVQVFGLRGAERDLVQEYHLSLSSDG